MIEAHMVVWLLKTCLGLILRIQASRLGRKNNLTILKMMAIIWNPWKLSKNITNKTLFVKVLKSFWRSASPIQPHTLLVLLHLSVVLTWTRVLKRLWRTRRGRRSVKKWSLPKLRPGWRKLGRWKCNFKIYSNLI